MNKFKFLVLGGGLSMTFGAMAAEYQCFEFSKMDPGLQSGQLLPAIVVLRNEELNIVAKQEVIALNEKTDDAIQLAQEGQEICLKGRKGYGSVSKFFAYEV